MFLRNLEGLMENIERILPPVHNKNQGTYLRLRLRYSIALVGVATIKLSIYHAISPVPSIYS